MQKIINIDWETGIKEVANNSVDLVLTDPPYGMSYQSNRRKEKHKSIKNDTNLN
jgi:site-specific DNA-methyltransferase (adenine-specific)